MKYMTGQNTAHAKELADLAVKLDEVGSYPSYHTIMDAVYRFFHSSINRSNCKQYIGK